VALIFRQTADTRAALATLRRALSFWPKSETEKDLRSNADLAALVTPDFNVVDFQNPLSAVRSVVRVEDAQGGKHVEFEGNDGYPYRAMLVRSPNSEWRLRALKFQCPACFGTGENLGTTCTLCDGEGWGAS
jgi:hypothetical protein